jgi:hypothetical protein
MLNIKLLEESKISVLVETNVNNFTCEFTNPGQFNALRFKSEVKADAIYFQDAILHLGVSEFDCGKELMNKDFRALLNEAEYPYITIEFKSLKWHDKEIREANKKMGKEIGLLEVLLSVAGTSHRKEVEVYTVEVLGHTLSGTGKIEVNIREFGLEPPEKFLGLVKVKETINIRFDLDMEQM